MEVKADFGTQSQLNSRPVRFFVIVNAYSQFDFL